MDTWDSEVFIDLNYGNLDIQKANQETDITLKASVRNIKGEEALSKEYTKHDLAFDNSNFFNEELCQARAGK